MPSNRHIVFIQKFIELILIKITAQARILEHDHPTIGRRLLQLRSMSTSDIQLLSDDGKVGHKSPDVSIGYPDRAYPQVVFEVAYNQDRGALERLAWDYTMGSSHYIRCVVGLTPDYLQNDSPFSPSPAHDVRVSVWRPLDEVEDYIENMDVKQETKDQRLGECNPDRAIAVLSLRDLLDVETPEKKATAPDIDFRIAVTSGEMIDILTSAELCLERSRNQCEHLLLESQNQNCI
ncbi:hypothetical protein KCU85_g2127, partial [Aureobasidium melanogenum]